MNRRWWAWVAWASLAASASAISIGIDAFSGQETVDTFTSGFARTEDPLTRPSYRLWEDGWGGGPGLGAFESGQSFFGGLPRASGGQALHDFRGATSVWFAFENPIDRLGLYVWLGTPQPIALSVFSVDGAELETVLTIPSTRGAFLGVERPERFRLGRLWEPNGANGHATWIDDVRFELASEPGTIAAVVVAVAALGRWRRRAG